MSIRSEYAFAIPVEPLEGATNEEMAQQMVIVSKALRIPVKGRIGGRVVIAYPQSTYEEVLKKAEPNQRSDHGNHD